MSVIIRLQNLPWSANAADIRAYFNGLSIPEGGVHIVGGEQGDAFIAFSTDEDARQAMLRDGGKLKEVKIKLFLSSRTEMLRIIEQARQQTLNLQTIMQTAAAQPVPAPLPVPTPQPQPFEPVPEIKENNRDEEGERTREEEDHRRERRDRERSGSRERGARSRDRERGRYNRDRDGRDSRRRRERSKSRERYRRRSRSRERNRRDKEGGAPRSSKRRDSDSDEKNSIPSREPPPTSTHHQQQQQQPALHQQQAPQAQLQAPTAVLHNSSQLHPHPHHLHHQQQGLAAPGLPLIQQQHHQLAMQALPSLKPALLPDPVLPAQLVMAMHKEMTPPAHVAFHQLADQDGRAPYRRDNWGPVPPHAHPHPHAHPVRHPHADPKFGQMPGYGAPPNYHHRPAAGGDYRHRTDGWGSPAGEDENDACIEIHGLPLNATYVDVKRLFEGLTIPPDGIKMINDNHGNRTGIAYVRFSRPGHKKLALNQNGKKVRSSIVEVLSLREAIYKTAVDNFKPDKDAPVKPDDADVDNGENPSDDWKKENDVARKASYHDPRTIGRNPVAKTNDVGRKEKGPSAGSGSERVLLKGLPPQAGDRDVLDLFSELGIAPLHIEFLYDNLGQPTGDAYCTFESSEEADKALSKNKTNMGRQTISVFSVAGEETERVEAYRPEPYVPHHYRPPFGPLRGGFNPRMEGGYPDPGHERLPRFPDARFAVGDKMGPERGRGRGRGRIRMGGPAPLPAPGRRPHAPARPTSPYIDGETLVHFGKPGCVVALENIHFKADIDEIMEFFRGFRVGHEDVIRRFDENGRPTGDARVALESPQEAIRAARTLSFKPIRGRPVKLTVMQ